VNKAVQKYSMHNLWRQLQGSDVISWCEQFLLSYSTGRTIIWCWARPVSDS